jgi:hypothetical protein
MIDQGGRRVTEKMPEKSREFIEAECLRVTRLQLGCHHVRSVRIGRTKPSGSGPNWEVFGFDPDLADGAKGFAMNAIDVLRGTYALAD